MNLYLTLTIFCVVAITKIQSSKLNPCEGLSDDVFVTDHSNCQKYFVCRNNQSISGTCDPYYFSEAKQVCVYEEDADCFECPAVGFKRFPIKTSCTQYIQCSAGASTTEECRPGLKFDAELEECSIDKSCIPNICPAFDIPASPVFIGSDTDCYTYYVCVGGKLEERICGPGLHWDQSTGHCNFPNVVKCPFAPLADCRDANSNHHLSHPHDCNKYFICMNDEAHIQQCANNMYFDLTMSRCDMPENVQCNATPAKRPILLL